MRNTLVIDQNNQCICIDSIAEKENTIYFLVYSEATSLNVVAYLDEGERTTITAQYYPTQQFFYFEIPTSLYPSEINNLNIQIGTSTFVFAFPPYLAGTMSVTKVSDYLYAINYTLALTKSQLTSRVSENTTAINNLETNLPDIIAETSTAEIIKSETMQTTWCYSRYIMVDFLETNFEALDITKSYQSLRKYIQIFEDNIKVIEAELSQTETETYTDPNGQTLYWTAIEGDNAYKFFTYTSPLTIAEDQRPAGITDEEFVELYTVKIRKTIAEYVKGTLGFPLNSGTGEPEFVLGAGDTNGNGKLTISKTTNDGGITYSSRIDGTNYGVVMKDDGTYQRVGNTDYTMRVIQSYANKTEMENDTALPIGSLAVIPQGGSE